MELSYPKFRYYVLFLYYKLRIFIDCTSGITMLLLAEGIHIWNYLFHTNYEMPGHDSVRFIETIFGKYNFIGDNYGYSILSPAFERPDKEYLISIMRKSLLGNKRVLYLDIGAFVGDYTIGVLKYLPKKNITTLAFEPDVDYYDLLVANCKLNAISTFKAYNIGLSNKKSILKTPRFPTLAGIVPSKEVTLRLKRLDDILPASYYKKFDEIVVKIDIEGHEEETFEGARHLIRSGKKIHLMIEDCVNPPVIRYLKKAGFKFITKITPYDSFWELH